VSHVPIPAPFRGIAAAVAAVALAGGCGGGDGGAPPPSTTTTAGVTVPRAAPVPPTGATPSTGTGTAPAGLVRLRGDGLSDASFGTPEDAVVALLAGPLGPPERGTTNPEVCGRRTRAAWKAPGIVAYFSEGRFDGWEVSKAGGAATAEGVRIGSTVGQVRSAYGTRFEWIPTSTLGAEFAVDRSDRPHLGGLADGTQDGGRVQHLWGGAPCAAR
jgi:hypothetical protein